MLKPEPETPYFAGTSAGWIDRTYLVKVPVGAAYFEIMPCLFQPAAERWTWRAARFSRRRREQLAESRPKIVPSETIAWANRGVLPPELHVAGNRLETADGKVGLAPGALRRQPGMVGGRREAREVHPRGDRPVEGQRDPLAGQG